MEKKVSINKRTQETVNIRTQHFSADAMQIVSEGVVEEDLHVYTKRGDSMLRVEWKHSIDNGNSMFADGDKADELIDMLVDLLDTARMQGWHER